MGLDLAVVSFLSATLSLFSLPWHWRARNIATLSVIAWLVLCNITRGVHAIIWNGNVIVKYEIWCDITSKFIIGANVGLPACIVCINRYLAESASPSPAILNATNKRRRMIFELGMCVGFPIVIMALHYVVQGHRFDIIEDFGCNPALYMSVPAILIIYLPPLVLSLIALVYAGIALRWFVHRRAQFQTVLRVSGSGLTTDRYLRLIALSITEMTFATAMTLFVLVTNVDSGVQPWVSWEYVHEDWMRVGQVAKIQMPGRSWNIFLITWYIVPLTSVIFFAFFGFLQETIEEYRRVIDWARTRVLGGKSKQSPVLPVTKPEDSSIYKSAGVSFLEL